MKQYIHYREYRFWGHSWCDLSTIFNRDLVTRKKCWKIASLVTPKSLFTVTHALFYMSSQKLHIGEISVCKAYCSVVISAVYASIFVYIDKNKLESSLCPLPYISILKCIQSWSPIMLRTFKGDLYHRLEHGWHTDQWVALRIWWADYPTNPSTKARIHTLCILINLKPVW